MILLRFAGLLVLVSWYLVLQLSWDMKVWRSRLESTERSQGYPTRSDRAPAATDLLHRLARPGLAGGWSRGGGLAPDDTGRR